MIRFSGIGRLGDAVSSVLRRRVIVLVAPLLSIWVLYMPSDLRQLPELGDSVVALVTMKHGIANFPTLPVFVPAEGSLFYGEALLLQAILYQLVAIFASDYVAYNITILLLLSLNASAIARYSLARSPVSPIASVILSVPIAAFPALFAYPGQLHMFMVAPLFIGIAELVRYARDRDFSVPVVAGCGIVLALSSLTYTLFLVMSCVLMVLFFPSMAVAGWRRLRADRATQILTGLCGLVCLTMLVLYESFGTGKSFSYSDFEMFGLSAVELARHYLILGHFDTPPTEASRYPLVAGFGVILVLLGGAAFRPGALVRLCVVTLVFAMLALGPYLGNGDDISRNYVFQGMSIMPGFDSVRVVSRYTVVASLFLSAIFVFSIARFRYAGRIYAVLLVLFLVQTWPVVSRGFSDVPDERVARLQAMDLSPSTTTSVHIPIYEPWPVSYDYMLFAVPDNSRTLNGVLSHFPDGYYAHRDRAYVCLVSEANCETFFSAAADDGAEIFAVHPYYWQYMEGITVSPERFYELCTEFTIRRFGEGRCVSFDEKR